MTLAEWFDLSEQETEEEICEQLYGHMFQTPVQYRSEPKGLELSWVVEGLLPETYLCVIAATSNAGKSCLITSLALAVASGEPFLGMPTTKSAVLWVAFEESKEERYLALAAHKKIPENFFVSHEKLFIDTLAGQDALRYWIRRTKAKLVVIDPLYAACVAETLSDGRKAREVLMGLKDLCRKERCAAIVLHHVTKDASAGQTRERFADSNQILATASMDLLMDFAERADGSRRIWLRGRGRGSFANRTWMIESSGVADFRLAAADIQAKVEEQAKDQALIDILLDSDAPLTADQIALSLRHKAGSIRNRLTQLVRRGAATIVGRAGAKGNANLYAPANDHSERPPEVMRVGMDTNPQPRNAPTP